MSEISPSLEEIVALRRYWADSGRIVVFTNGCFDLLHPGHVRYLTDAKALGDRLIVGLNDDDSVRRLKGDDAYCPRPLNTLEDRYCMLKALRAVDVVLPFAEDTPLRVIKALLPDVLVKGGDYREANIVGAREVRDNGGEVRIIPFVGDYSSTGLIRRIQAAGKQNGET